MPNNSNGSNPIKQSASEENVPYVGPQPFTSADRDIFFGRKQEAVELTSLVKAHSETLLFAPSGAGKTSLLYAQVLPLLYHEEEFDVLKAARVRSQESATIPDTKISNIYMFNALKDLSDDKLSLIERAQLTLAEYLERRPRPLLEPEEANDEHAERRLARVIVFDQFEEIFTLYPERYKDRQNFFTQVADALKADPFLRVVFSMREDYIAELEPYSGVLPQGLRTRYRLERLRKANALIAVEEPLKSARVKTHRHFEDGAAELLVERLMLIKVKTGSGEKIEVPGEFVDPVQLQVVCQTLWEKLPSEKVIITKEDIDEYANVDEALSDFYQNCVRKAVAAVGGDKNGAVTITEGLVRGWFEQKLITKEGKRSMVLRERNTTAGLSNLVVDELENQHVIRVEMRGGEPWYELSHDRFIPPIREANRRFVLQQPVANRKAEELEARAAEWLESGRSETLLLNRGELADAQNWMNSEAAAAIGHSETLFSLIQASEAAIEHEDNKQQLLLAEARERRMIAERQRTRQLKMGFVMASVLLAFAVVSWFSASRSEATAKTALAQATTAQEKEKQERQNAETAAKYLAVEKENVIKEKTEAEKARKRAEAAKLVADEKTREANAARARSESVVDQLNTFSIELERSTNNAWSLKLAADANAVINDDPEKSLTLALLAAEKAETPQAKDVVGRAFLKRKDREIFRGHTNKVWSAIYGPNGQVFTMSEDGAVGIWNPKSKDVKMLTSKNPVHAFAISLDGNWLVTEELNEVGRIWNLRDGTSKQVDGLAGPVAALALSPNGKFLVTEANDKEEKPGSSPRVWDVSTGARLRTLNGHTDAVSSIAFSPSGVQIATASWDGTARIWDTATGNELNVLKGHTAPLTSIEFDSSGEFVVTGSFDGTARVWNVSTGKEQAVLRGHTGVVNSAVFSPDDKLILTGGRAISDRVKMVPQPVPLPEDLRTRVGTPDTSARLWDARTGQLIDTLMGHTGDVNSAVFSSDGNLVLTAGEDGLVLVWSTDSGTIVNKLQGHNGPVNTAVFSPNNFSVLTASEDKTAQTWCWKHNGSGEFAAHDGQVIRTTVNDDGSIVTAGLDGRLRRWTINSDLKVDPVRGGAEVDLSSLDKSPKQDAPPVRVRDLTLSPKGDVVVTASVIPGRTRYRANDDDGDTNAHVWNVKTRKFHELTGHKEPVMKVLFSSSGAYVFTLSRKQLQLWDTTTWKSTPFTINSDSVLLNAAFSPDEQALFMIQSDGQLLITNLKKLETRSIELAPRVSRAVFNTQANRVAAAVSDDLIGVWDMDGIRKSTVKASDALKVAFSQDSALLFTASLDTRIQVWKTETGEAVTETERFDFPLTSLAFDSRLSSLLIGDGFGRVHIIDCELCRPFDQIKKMAIESHPRPLTPAELREYLPDEKR